MQPFHLLQKTLEQAPAGRYLFTTGDFSPLFPDLSVAALRMLLSRAVEQELLLRVCKGVYIYSKAGYQKGLVLYHTASRLREESLSYLSLESVLSGAGLISQIPLGWITLMTRGRSGKINCGPWGTIEFIHTQRKSETLMDELSFDGRYCLWRASVKLALHDMKLARRPMDLVDLTMTEGAKSQLR
jgi:predicted transcriptional regulator of viral defense system